MPDHRPIRAPLRPGTAVRTSAQSEHGVSRARLRANRVQHPFTGVSAVGLDLHDVHDRCVAYAPLLRTGDAFSHCTAAALYGVPLPSSLSPAPLHVLSPIPASRARTAGVVGHRRTRPYAVESVRGLPVVSPVVAWLQLAQLVDRGDLTAAGDFMVTGRRLGYGHLEPLASIRELRAALLSGEVRRGRTAAAWALERIRRGADSRPETLLRLLIVAAGLPEPVVAAPVRMADGAVWHPDLAYPRRRIAIEYQGAPHWDQHVWKRDTERRERFEDLGWRAFFVTSSDLFRDPEPFLARLRRSLDPRNNTDPPALGPAGS